MKRKVCTLVSLLLVVVTIVSTAAPALALGSTSTIKETGGSCAYINGVWYEYRCTTRGSTTAASGSMTYGRSWRLGCNLDLTVWCQGVEMHKYVTNVSSGTDVTVSTDNMVEVDGVYVPGEIERVNSTFDLGGRLTVYDEVS